jgi:hypothetical protein
VDLKRIRKALIAGAGAVVGVVVAGVQLGAPSDADGWAVLVVSAVGTGLLAAWAAWRVPNAPAAPYQVGPGRPPG